MYMDLDMATRRNLEITETMRDKLKRGSLLWVLDKTKTSMGARMLKQWVEKPLVNPIEINKRLYSVKELVDNLMLRDEITDALSGTYDISRIISRLSLNTASPRDLVSLKLTLTKLPELNMALSSAKSPILSGIARNFDILSDVRELIDSAISDDAPLTMKDGGVIKNIDAKTAEVMAFDSIDGSYKIQKVADKKDIYVTVEADVDVSDLSIKTGDTAVRVGAEIPVRGKGFAAMGYVVTIDKE